MTTPAGNTNVAAALSAPPQRPRANKSNLPKPPGSGDAAQPTQIQEEPAAPITEPKPTPAPTPQPTADPAPAAAAPPASRARRLLAARNAEQTFLPLISRVAKLREWVEQAELAIADATATGVERGQLEDTLRSIARKNEVPFEDIPESVRRAVSTA